MEQILLVFKTSSLIQTWQRSNLLGEEAKKKNFRAFKKSTRQNFEEITWGKTSCIKRRWAGWSDRGHLLQLGSEWEHSNNVRVRI